MRRGVSCCDRTKTVRIETDLRVAVYWKVDIVFVVEFKLFPPRALERAANTKDRML